MSHFSVLVIGDNVEAQLAPYHEFECTGDDNEYVVEVEKDVDELIAELKEYDVEITPQGVEDWNGMASITAEQYNAGEIDLEDTHKYGYAVWEGDTLIHAIQRTNPNAKWDWWVIGGRWSGMLKLKNKLSLSGMILRAKGDKGRPGLMGSNYKIGDRWVDVAYRGDIDFDAMREEAIQRATKEFDQLAEVFADGSRFKSWEQVVAEHNGDYIAAREVYQAQPTIVKLKEAAQQKSITLWDYDYTFAGGNRDIVIERARNSAGVPYAVVKDGKWYSKGEMGWFGMSDDEMTQGEWDAQVTKMLNELDPHTLITVVDCHI